MNHNLIYYRTTSYFQSVIKKLIYLRLDYGQTSNKRRIFRCGLIRSKCLSQGGAYSDLSVNGAVLTRDGVY